MRVSMMLFLDDEEHSAATTPPADVEGRVSLVLLLLQVHPPA